MHGHGESVHIPFPFNAEDLKGGELIYGGEALRSHSDSLNLLPIPDPIHVMQCKTYVCFSVELCSFIDDGLNLFLAFRVLT